MLKSGRVGEISLLFTFKVEGLAKDKGFSWF